MKEWPPEGHFGRRCLAALARSELPKQGFFDGGCFPDTPSPRRAVSGGFSFLSAVLNAVFWHESRVMGREDCL